MPKTFGANIAFNDPPDLLSVTILDDSDCLVCPSSDTHASGFILFVATAAFLLLEAVIFFSISKKPNQTLPEIITFPMKMIFSSTHPLTI